MCKYSRLLLHGHLVNFDDLILKSFYFIQKIYFLLHRCVLARGFQWHTSDPISRMIFKGTGRKTVRIWSFLFFKIYLIVDTRTSAVRVSWAAWEVHVGRYFWALPQKSMLKLQTANRIPSIPVLLVISLCLWSNKLIR